MITHNYNILPKSVFGLSVLYKHLGINILKKNYYDLWIIIHSDNIILFIILLITIYVLLFFISRVFLIIMSDN